VSRSRSSIRFSEKRQTAKYSLDGQCGPAVGNLLCDPKSTVYTGSCCSQYGWVCIRIQCAPLSKTDPCSAVLLQPTAVTDVFLVATTALSLPLSRLLRRKPLLPVRRRPETTAGAVRILLELPVTPRAPMVVAAHLTVTVAPPMVTVSWPTVAKTVARTAHLPTPLLPLSLPLVPRPSLLLESLFLVSPRPWPKPSQLAFQL
jgi:hypothetical protein